jgi:branched-chain amino acid transport system substrate-binding protein
MERHRRRQLLTALAAVALFAVLLGISARPAEGQGGEVHLAMISPLTGPLSFVGVDNRAGVEAAIREINARGGVKGRRIRLTIFDDGSNPSQGVVHMQRIVGDDKFVGVIGSGFSSVGLAVRPIVEQRQIPYISMASSAAQVTPARQYYYMTTATSRLFAYSMAIQLRKLGIRRIALMNDAGGFGQEGARNVKELARRFGFEIVQDITFPLTGTTSFTAELNRVKNSNAQALWLWNATSLAITITKEARQLRLSQRLVLTGGNASPQYLGPACPEANGALINTYLGPVAQFLPRSNPSRAIALRVNRLIRKQGSTFNYDGYTAVNMFRTAMLRGGFDRGAINRALESRMRGFVGPGGRYYYSDVNHSGLGVNSMVISQIKNCKMVPVKGQKVLQAKKK